MLKGTIVQGASLQLLEVSAYFGGNKCLNKTSTLKISVIGGFILGVISTSSEYFVLPEFIQNAWIKLWYNGHKGTFL